MRTVEGEGTLSHPPVRHRADSEGAFADLLRIGSGLGTRATRSYSTVEAVALGIAAGLVVVFLLALGF